MGIPEVWPHDTEETGVPSWGLVLLMKKVNFRNWLKWRLKGLVLDVEEKTLAGKLWMLQFAQEEKGGEKKDQKLCYLRSGSW